uniref:Uncharacterized protein n=1 Tax=viral metagenome TaxID=1070528 RepID=A0A6H1ZTB7_9ZZZZ
MSALEREHEIADACRAQADENRKKIGLASAVLRMAGYPEFAEYQKAICEVVDAKVRRLVAGASDGPLDVSDRKRAELSAEIRLLKFLFEEPERAEKRLSELKDATEKLEARADEIDRKFYGQKGL